MLGSIEKKDIKHLADLARIDLKPEEEEKLLKDAEAILVYFEELGEVNTDDVSGMAGATDIVNATGGDEVATELIQKGIESFPESEKNCLKVPGVMKSRDE